MDKLWTDIIAIISALASVISTIVAVLTYKDSKREFLPHSSGTIDSAVEEVAGPIADESLSHTSVDLGVVVGFATEYNRKVARYELSLFAVMVALGVLSWSLTNNFWSGFGTGIGSSIILGNTVWKAVVKNGSKHLRRLAFSQPFSVNQKAECVPPFTDEVAQ